MLRRSTLVFILILVAVIGFSVYFNKNKEKQATIDTTLTPQAQTEYLFNAADGAPTGIHIESKSGEVVDLARNAESAWALIKPIEASADQGLSEAAASQISQASVTQKEDSISAEGLLGTLSEQLGTLGVHALVIIERSSATTIELVRPLCTLRGL